MNRDEQFRDVHDVTYLLDEVVGPSGTRRTIPLVGATVAVGISVALGGMMMNLYDHSTPAARPQPRSQFEATSLPNVHHQRSWNLPGPYDASGCQPCEWRGPKAPPAASYPGSAVFDNQPAAAWWTATP